MAIVDLMSTASTAMSDIPDLKNVREWVAVDRFIFDEHADFGCRELREIADNSNRREDETCDLCPITLGCEMPQQPETAQPAIVGFARRIRVEKTNHRSGRL